MADFWQQGAITVLQRLKKRPIEELEGEIEAIAWRRHIVLLLPALYSEFETPAMPRIVAELKHVRYLHKIVVSLDRADERQFQHVKTLMRGMSQNVKIIWQDGPGLQPLYQELRDADLTLQHPGKGQSVWMALGYILAERDVYPVATHDCDIVDYQREMLARLVYPVVHPATDFEFSKGYYARVTDRLYGRVTRLFYTPMIRTLRRILGHNPFLAYLDNFRYALSGEFRADRQPGHGHPHFAHLGPRGDRNYFFDLWPVLAQVTRSNLVRGAVSGLGVINLWAAMAELSMLFGLRSK